jgi:hypothetical protein
LTPGRINAELLTHENERIGQKEHNKKMHTLHKLPNLGPYLDFEQR